MIIQGLPGLLSLRHSSWASGSFPADRRHGTGSFDDERPDKHLGAPSRYTLPRHDAFYQRM